MRTPEIDFSLLLADELSTDRCGEVLAKKLTQGDTLLLSGSIGSGKSHLARAIIRSRLPVREDIPSPTYTIVQTYADQSGEIWHADLYRLGDSSELTELGLDEALGNSLVLIEWPDRLPPELLPQDALYLDLATDGDGRRARVFSYHSRWTDLVALLANV